MSELPGVVVMGGSGRMGQMLIREIQANAKARLAGVLERPGHDWVGRDVGDCMGGQPVGVNVSDDPLEVMVKAQAVIDFTAPPLQSPWPRSPHRPAPFM